MWGLFTLYLFTCWENPMDLNNESKSKSKLKSVYWFTHGTVVRFNPSHKVRPEESWKVAYWRQKSRWSGTEPGKQCCLKGREHRRVKLYWLPVIGLPEWGAEWGERNVRKWVYKARSREPGPETMTWGPETRGTRLGMGLEKSSS